MAILAAEPEVTVTLALPDTLPEVATAVPLPDTTALNNPPDVMLPIPPVTVQVGAMETTLSFASLPTAANCCVLPDATVAGLGVTVMVAKDPATPVALKVTGDPDRPVEVAVTVFVPGVVPRVRSVEAFPSEPVSPDVADSAPFPEVMANATLTPLTGLPTESFTITTNGLAKAVPKTPLWPLPLTREMLAAAPVIAIATVALALYFPSLTVTLTTPAPPGGMDEGGAL
jgi:hypothetical protein